MKKLAVFTLAVFAILLAVPAFAADRAIANGIDLWQTPGDGTTFADFSKQSIPAGFFCQNSEPFTGRVVLKGVPIASNGALGDTDTIIQRLDNTTFNKRGVARTRIQMRAMQFEGVAPVKTVCGDYKLRVVLDGVQPVTTMRIVRDSPKGGRFFAPIHVNIKLVFEPVGRVTTEALEIRKALRFPPARLQEWSFSRNNVNGFVKVDTDSDGTPDTFLPGGTSGFVAGLSAAPKIAAYTDPVTGCHIEDEGQHCPVVYQVALE
ncbi:MAG TPA: hypothetical protein VG477_11940 [Thermoanaerobaculia bacterium]|nr:hypothetical protein [Thermoanaerobaculia bacterium]